MIITSRTLSSLALAGALCLPGGLVARAQVVADDVVCSKCVDDTDIAPDSVGTAKIKDKSIQAVDLAPNSVGTAKIKDKSITSVDLAPNSVGTAKIKDGSITGDELAPDAVFGRTLLIRADPLDPAGNCLALLDALAGITDNDADNRYTILLAPGIYDCGVTTVEMKEFVDIAGSGRDTTVLKGASGDAIAGVLKTAGNAELRHLTVEHAGGSGFAVAITSILTDVRITDVAARVAGPAAEQILLFRIAGGAPVLSDVEIIASEPSARSVGLSVQGGATVQLENVIARGPAAAAASNHGVFIFGCPNTISARNSVFSGATSAIDASICFDSATELNFVSSELDGGLDVGATPLVVRCVGSYDGGFAPLDAACN